MRSPLELRNDAMDCMRIAEAARARGKKSLYLMMAQAWTRLAEQAEHLDAPHGAAPVKRKSKPH
jgi:hypothetical protein